MALAFTGGMKGKCVLLLFVIDELSKINQGVRVACILGWGPRRWREPDSIRSLGKLGMVSLPNPLAGGHAQGVTAFLKARRNFLRGYYISRV